MRKKRSHVTENELNSEILKSIKYTTTYSWS